MPGFLYSKVDYAKAKSKSDMDLDPIYNPKLHKQCLRKIKEFEKKLQDVHQKLEKIETGVQDLIQWLESNDKKFL
jgi:hypothetical protein